MQIDQGFALAHTHQLSILSYDLEVPNDAIVFKDS